ncbi:MAG TPA: hypothetical protein VI197_14645 [Polyangiaceae bacterium]
MDQVLDQGQDQDWIRFWSRGQDQQESVPLASKTLVNSARETMMALRLAGARCYLSSAEAQAGVWVLDGIIAVLWTLASLR